MINCSDLCRLIFHQRAAGSRIGLARGATVLSALATGRTLLTGLFQKRPLNIHQVQWTNVI
jgi:hypothetical protein